MIGITFLGSIILTYNTYVYFERKDFVKSVILSFFSGLTFMVLVLLINQ